MLQIVCISNKNIIFAKIYNLTFNMKTLIIKRKV